MLKIDETALVIIDVQGKLATIMHESEGLLNHLENMIKGAQVLNIPIIWLEQYPKGLGPTADSLKQHLTSSDPIAKITFSACQNEQFQEALKRINRKSLLVTGIESHICVYQTVRELLNLNHHVELVVDCISSRTAENRQVGIDRMVSLGAHVTSVEMALFELMGTAEHPNFREISRIIK